eukprot:CAMPEP_0168568698 /NCGR_PEP_ID=MMETSP0413-20121227/15719_1 /TAXON_ID=136452 /ORGANISM="Filamoeba nolandi, Strain NC-AS-23-1" /LENGTH=501 /DNA_ID=CAMNT_0008601057 /DNA_START=89 /DNA_END=1591 /DNA_ORIENTATION=+
MEDLKSLKNIYDIGLLTREEFDHYRNSQQVSSVHSVHDPPPGLHLQQYHHSPVANVSVNSLTVEDSGLDKSQIVYLPSSGQASLLTNSDVQDNTHSERFELAKEISKMRPENLEAIIHFIGMRSPSALKFNPNNAEYSFDLDDVDHQTLTTIQMYIAGLKDGSTQNLISNSDQSPQISNNGMSPIPVIGTPPKRKLEDLGEDTEQEMLEVPQDLPTESSRSYKRKKKQTPRNDMLSLDSSNAITLPPLPSITQPPPPPTTSTRPPYSQRIANVQIESTTQEAQTIVQEPEKEPPAPPKKIKIKIQIHKIEKSGTGPKPWKCDSPACNKAFSDSSNLIKHLRSHTKEKPYICSFKGCGKKYTHSASLKEHSYTHTGKKPFTCAFEGCNRSFAQHSNLRRHMRIHTGDKPYSCPECGKTFNQSSNLNQHVKTHQKGKPRSRADQLASMVAVGESLGFDSSLDVQVPVADGVVQQGIVLPPPDSLVLQAIPLGHHLDHSLVHHQ